MGFNEAFVAIMAVLGIVAIVTLAVATGHDGLIITAGMTALGGVVGFSRGRRKGQNGK